MLQKIIGDNDLASFGSAWFFCIIGVAISLLWHTTKRDPQSAATPVCFDLKFLMLDNIKRFVLGFLLIYVVIRFYPNFFHESINDYAALGVGLGFDKIAELIKGNSTLLDMNRNKIIDSADKNPSKENP
jgi:hypothetical protein